MDEKDLTYIKLRELALQREFSGGITDGLSNEAATAVIPVSINQAIIGQENLQEELPLGEEQNVDCSGDSTGYASVIAHVVYLFVVSNDFFLRQHLIALYDLGYFVGCSFFKKWKKTSLRWIIWRGGW